MPFFLAALGALGAVGAAIGSTTGILVTTITVTTVASITASAVGADQTKKAAEKQGKDQQEHALLSATIRYGTNLVGAPLKINT